MNYLMNFLNLGKRVILILIICLFFTNHLSALNHVAIAGGVGLSTLIIKKVFVDNFPISQDDYMQGKDLYENYSYHGLPDNFLIRTEPDVLIEPGEVKYAEIGKMPFSPPKMNVYKVVLHLGESAATKVKNFSQKNLNSYIAIEIDGKIFVISKILDVIADEINITVSKKDIEIIDNAIRKITKDVRHG